MSSGAAEAGGGQQALERASLGVAGAAALVYLLHSLPAVLFPSGLLASVLTLLAGMLLGLVAGGAALALAFYQLTHPKPGQTHAPHAAEPLQPQRARRRRGAGNAATTPGPTLPHAIAIGGEFSGVVYTAPASAWRRCDTVASWPPTCDPSQPFKAWEATLAQGTLVLRPIVPPPGAKVASPPRGSTAAAVKQAAQPVESAAAAGHAEAQQGAVSGADDAAAAPAASAAAPAKVGIPLEGCTLELVADGLNGRSEYIRRAPLLLSHPKWPLLEGERAFYLWADDPASKQQWVHALGWWCQDGEKLSAIQAMYSAYCDAMRDRTVLEYVEHAPQWGDGSGAHHMTPAAGEGSAGAAEAGAGAQAAAGSQRQPAVAGERKKGLQALGAKFGNWKRKVDGRRRGSSSQDGGGEPGGASPGRPGLGESSLPPSASPSPAKAQQGRQAQQLPAELASLDAIMEARWTQSRKIQVPPSISEVVKSQSRSSSRATSPKAIPRPPSLSAVTGAGAGVAGSLGGSGSLAGSFAEGGMVTPPGGSPVAGGSPAVAAGVQAVRRADTSPAPLGTGTGAAGSPAQLPAAGAGQQQLEAKEVDGSATALGAGALQQQPAAAAAAGAKNRKGVSDPSAGPAALPTGLPPLLSPDYAVNAFVARVAFDVLRRPDFQELLRARIQRQLSRLQRPDFIQTLDVVGVDAGAVAPTLRNLRALPQPGADVWPQLLFDLRYQGAFTVTIEMKVDIRDAAAWGRLDQALTRLAEGRRRGSGADSSESGGPTGERTGGVPPHAASAPALRGGGSSGSPGRAEEALEEMLLEEAEFEQPLSPQSSAGLPALTEGSDEAGAAGNQQHQEGSEGSGRAGKRGIIGGIRQSAARRLRQLAESTAVQIARIPLRLSLTFSLLEGTMCAWLPPPPGNRLFYSFVTPPALEVTASPELGGRLLKYSYHVARVSSWIEHRMRAAITRNMVFPGGGDVVLPQLMDLSHLNAADALPALGRYMQQQQRQQAASAQLPRRQQQEHAKQAAAATQADEQQQEHAKQAAAATQADEQQQAAEAEGREGAEDAAGAPASIDAAATAAARDAAPSAAQTPASEPSAASESSPAGASAGPAAERLQQDAGPTPAAAVQTAPESGSDVATAAGASVCVVEPLAGLFAGAADTRDLGSAAARSSSSGRAELLAEPSLSLSHLAGSSAAAPTAAAMPSGPAEEQDPAVQGALNGSSGSGSEQGHLISPRYDKHEEGGSARARPAGPASPEFRGWAAPAAAAPAAGEGRTRTAADAWDAAMAQEAAGEVPTPRFAGQLWQQAPAAAQQAAAPAMPLASGLHLPPAGQAQSGAGEEAPPSRRPALKLKLSATRSLDPDFTRSAEHTRFGESPAHALPDYGGSSVRRTLSARVDGSSGGIGSAGPSSARGSGRGAVQDSLNRSLAYLRRQSSGLRQRDPQEQAQHAEPAGSGAGPASPQQQQHEAREPSASSPPQHSSSPQSSEGGLSSNGDPRRLRQQGSIKEQAGKLFTRMVREGKALASQVQQMQQQRAVARSHSSPGHGSTSPPHQ